MMHRFAMPDLGIQGHDPAVLAQRLEYLRRRGYALLSMMDLLDDLDRNAPLKTNALVFTVDDGYADFAEVAAPVFAKYDCPVTVFLVTDFVAGRQWNWFDRVSWAFAHTSVRKVAIEVTRQELRLHWTTPAECERSSGEVVRQFKGVSDAAKEALIGTLSAALEIEIPERAPTGYQAMSWDEVRVCARWGVTFGPHSVTHPILSQVDDRRAEREISESWRVVRDATDAAVPVFCYPNGTSTDFSDREKEYVERAGLKAAVSAIPGFVEPGRLTIPSADRFSLPRFPYSEHKHVLVQAASGIEAMKARIKKTFTLN
jgi:peptidoglycan/xylan/chitin deacetylase (PgdA/CDA1 family)